MGFSPLVLLVVCALANAIPADSANTTQATIRTPYSFDYLIAADDYFDTPATVVFVEYEISAEVISRYTLAGKTVFCHVNVGSWEFWREDANHFPEEILGNDFEEWPGEKWLDVTNIALLIPLMRERFRSSFEKGCRGIAADNMAGYEFDTGFEITYQDQLAYNRFIASEIHVLGLLAVMINDPLQVTDLLDSFDLVVSNGCVAAEQCNFYEEFIDNGKPAFDIEYLDVYDEERFRNEICPLTATTGISFILKGLEETANNYFSCV